jgi:hypothetical protein
MENNRCRGSALRRSGGMKNLVARICSINTCSMTGWHSFFHDYTGIWNGNCKTHRIDINAYLPY